MSYRGKKNIWGWLNDEDFYFQINCPFQCLVKERANVSSSNPEGQDKLWWLLKHEGFTHADTTAVSSGLCVRQSHGKQVSGKASRRKDRELPQSWRDTKQLPEQVWPISLNWRMGLVYNRTYPLTAAKSWTLTCCQLVGFGNVPWFHTIDQFFFIVCRVSSRHRQLPFPTLYMTDITERQEFNSPRLIKPENTVY